MKILFDVTPHLLEAIRSIIREELERKAEEIRKEPKSFSRKEVAGILNCSLPTLDKHLSSGRIKSQKVEGKIFIPESSVSNFLNG